MHAWRFLRIRRDRTSARPTTSIPAAHRTRIERPSISRRANPIATQARAEPRLAWTRRPGSNLETDSSGASSGRRYSVVGRVYTPSPPGDWVVGERRKPSPPMERHVIDAMATLHRTAVGRTSRCALLAALAGATFLDPAKAQSTTLISVD